MKLLFKQRFSPFFRNLNYIFFGWDHKILDPKGQKIAAVSKQLFNRTDTYAIDVFDQKDALCALMLVLAIDAEKCSGND